jgi:hypothetical protein
MKIKQRPRFKKVKAKLGGYFVTLNREMNPKLSGGWMFPKPPKILMIKKRMTNIPPSRRARLYARIRSFRSHLPKTNPNKTIPSQGRMG